MKKKLLSALAAMLCAACLACALAEGGGFFMSPVATPAPEAIQLPSLYRGDRGGYVRILQQMLIELDYLSGGADGDFGGKTESAVRQAQAMAGLASTGVADGAFLARLYSGGVPDAYGDYVEPATRIVRYSATSQHRDKYGSYTVDNAFDGRLDTTWAEDASGYGEGEGISFTVATFGRDSFILDLWAGYQKKSSIYYNNGRPKDILLTVDGHAFAYQLADTMSSQSFTIPNADGKLFMELGVTIQSVYPGKKWKDTCISEIQVR